MFMLSFDTSQFGLFVLLALTLFFLYMGYGMQDRKQGGWFLLFGGIFTFSLMIGVIHAFHGVWWFTSPAFILFAVVVLKDALMLILYGKQYRR